MKSALNLQDIFLNHCRKDHTPITIFLVSGYQIKGYVKGLIATQLLWIVTASNK